MKRCFRIIFLALLPMLFLLQSCSDADYRNVVPTNSVALMYFDATGISNGGEYSLVKSLLGTDDLHSIGIDLQSRIYAFETTDGNVGLCAKVDNADALGETVGRMAKQGEWSDMAKQDGINFACISHTWLLGYNDDALLVVGPIVAAAQPEMRRRMAKWFGNDGSQKRSNTSSQLLAMLDTLDSPMALVAQCDALPEKFVAPFTLCVPKAADMSKVLLKAEVSLSDGCLGISGNVLSRDKQVDAAIKNNAATLRPIGSKYVQRVPSESMATFFANVRGTDFLPMLQANKSMQALLAGINTAIDMDNIIRCIDGNMALSLVSMSDGNTLISMGAEQASVSWLNDVDYWKKSCPSGSRLDNWQSNSYCYSSDHTTFYFGATPDKQFYGGSTKELAMMPTHAAAKPLAEAVSSAIIGKRMAILINMDAILATDAVPSNMSAMLKQLTSGVHTLLYSIQ